MLQKKISGFILDMKQRLGKGVYGEVYLAVDTSNDKCVAVKQVPLNSKNTSQHERTYQLIQNEIKIMRSIQNPNVVSLINVQRTPNNIYIVMEFCNQGTLEEYISRKCEDKTQKKIRRAKYLSEKEGLLFMSQIVNGFRALYKQKIVHRDLKLQNILMHDGEAKIADFGFSKVIEFEMEEPLLKTYAGSPLYMSIQILREQQYSSKCDVWSLGVIMYEILYGQPPWIAVSIPDLIFKIENTKLRLPERPVVSQETQQLIIRMLTIPEAQRIGWEEIFQHAYFNEKMEIEEDMQMKQNVDRIEGQYGKDGLRKSNAKKKLYFDRNSVIQNTNHAQKQQIRLQKIFEIPQQQEGSPMNRYLQQDQQTNVSLNSQHSNNSNNISNVSQQQPRNKIFEQVKDRSISPRCKSPLSQQVDQNYALIFQKNKIEMENKKITQKISDWIIHRRNKSVFLNTVSQKWFDLFDSGRSCKYSYILSFFICFDKILNNHLFQNELQIGAKTIREVLLNFIQNLINRSNKFTKQQWNIFTKSNDFKTTATQIKNDFYVVRGFLIELIQKAKEELDRAIKNDQDQFLQKLNINIHSICNMDLIDKSLFDPIFQENMSYMFQLSKNLLLTQIQKLTQREELQQYLFYNKELLIFTYHLNNAVRIKEIFKYSQDKPVDFFKYYEEINNETPIKIAQILGLVK